jgi:hypothetical protein
MLQIKNILHYTFGVLSCLSWLASIIQMFKLAGNNDNLFIAATIIAILYSIMFLLTAPKMHLS